MFSPLLFIINLIQWPKNLKRIARRYFVLCDGIADVRKNITAHKQKNQSSCWWFENILIIYYKIDYWQILSLFTQRMNYLFWRSNIPRNTTQFFTYFSNLFFQSSIICLPNLVWLSLDICKLIYDEQVSHQKRPSRSGGTRAWGQSLAVEKWG